MAIRQAHTKRVKRGAFSLFEALLCVVILGILGFVCSSMLLHITQNIAFSKATSDTAPRLALMQIENLLQNAILESITSDGTTSLKSPAQSMHFARFSDDIFGMARDNAPFSPYPTHHKSIEIRNDTLMPHISLEIDKAHDKSLEFATLKGWKKGDLLHIISLAQPSLPFKPYRVEALTSQGLVLDRALPPQPLLAIPITLYTLKVYDEILWLNHVPLLHNVASFEASLVSLPHAPSLLRLKICQKRAKQVICVQNAIALESKAQILP